MTAGLFIYIIPPLILFIIHGIQNIASTNISGRKPHRRRYINSRNSDFSE